jgi:hypothetical protein
MRRVNRNAGYIVKPSVAMAGWTFNSSAAQLMCYNNNSAEVVPLLTDFWSPRQS